MAKAILLLSGGLDSTLAGALLKELGVEVEGLNFVTPFCQCSPKSLGCSAAKRAAKQIGIEVRLEKCGREYLEIVKNPRFGWGSGVNPCIDCSIHIVEKTKEVMQEIGAEFIVTGEVLGQRPKSQMLHALLTIEKTAGLEGKILRPLSAQLLPPTLMEKSGLIDRDKLLNIRGRRRNIQVELGRQYNLIEFAQNNWIIK